MIGFFIFEAVLGFVAFLCFVYVLLALADAGERTKAVVLFLLTPLLIGPLLAFFVGVRRANRLGVENALCVWTVCALLGAGTSLLGVSVITAQGIRDGAARAAARERLSKLPLTGTSNDGTGRPSPCPCGSRGYVVPDWALVLPGLDLGPLVSGAGIGPVPPALRHHVALAGAEGVLVWDVRPGSAAEQAGLRQYDVILEVNGRPCTEGTVAGIAPALVAMGVRSADIVVRRGPDRVVLKGLPLAD